MLLAAVHGATRGRGRSGDAVADHGIAHEARHVQRLRDRGLSVVEIAQPGPGRDPAALHRAQAQTLDKNRTNVSQTNSVYQTQIDTLAAAEANIDELDASLAALRQQIAATPKLDDVYEIVDDAAKKADVRVENVTAADPTAWTARTWSRPLPVNEPVPNRSW